MVRVVQKPGFFTKNLYCFSIDKGLKTICYLLAQSLMLMMLAQTEIQICIRLDGKRSYVPHLTWDLENLAYIGSDGESSSVPHLTVR